MRARVLFFGIAMAGCGDNQLDIADKLAAEAGRMGLSGITTTGPGRFASAEIRDVTVAQCDDLVAYARRTFNDPHDCARLYCKPKEEVAQNLVACGGFWSLSGGCAKCL